MLTQTPRHGRKGLKLITVLTARQDRNTPLLLQVRGPVHPPWHYPPPSIMGQGSWPPQVA